MDLQGTICRNCNAPEEYCPDVAYCSTVRAVTEYVRSLELEWIRTNEQLSQPSCEVQEERE